MKTFTKMMIAAAAFTAAAAAMAKYFCDYALGSGNSIAPYIPVENFMALIRAAADTDAQ